MKHCTTCPESDLANFYKRKDTTDGLERQCKNCKEKKRVVVRAVRESDAKRGLHKPKKLRALVPYNYDASWTDNLTEYMRKTHGVTA